MAVQAKAFDDLEGPDFVRSSDVEAVGEKVLELHGGIGGVPRLHPIAEAVRDDELSILWLLNEKPWNDEAEDDQEPEIAGKCVKAPRIWHDVTGYHFAIWIRKHFWDLFVRAAAQFAGEPEPIAAGVTPDNRVGELLCQGANHVPGHTAGCPLYSAS